MERFLNRFALPGYWFSAYLRRRWNESHFAIAAYAAVALSLLLIYEAYIVWTIGAMLVDGIISLLWLSFAKDQFLLAKRHSRPDSVTANTGFMPFFCTLLVAPVILYLAAGSRPDTYVAVCLALVSFYLAAIDGMEIDHERQEEQIPAHAHGSPA